MPDVDPKGKTRWTLEEREELFAWQLSSQLFGDTGWNMNDFDASNYVYFLDTVGSLEDLVEGLRELSPLADDALDIAEAMTPQDFFDFKLCLAHERGRGKIDGSKMTKRYRQLCIPKRFVKGCIMAQQFEVPLGAALQRMAELGIE